MYWYLEGRWSCFVFIQLVSINLLMMGANTSNMACHSATICAFNWCLNVLHCSHFLDDIFEWSRVSCLYGMLLVLSIYHFKVTIGQTNWQSCVLSFGQHLTILLTDCLSNLTSSPGGNEIDSIFFSLNSLIFWIKLFPTNHWSCGSCNGLFLDCVNFCWFFLHFVSLLFKLIVSFISLSTKVSFSGVGGNAAVTNLEKKQVLLPGHRNALSVLLHLHVKVVLWSKFYLPFSLRFLKVLTLNSNLAKF